MCYHIPKMSNILFHRKEMVDRDIIMLQLAAANMPSDDFLINVVSKFQLIPWSSEEFDLKEDDRRVLLFCHKNRSHDF